MMLMCGMDNLKKKPKAVQVTLSTDDLQLLKDISEITGNKPAKMMREMIEESRPQLLSILKALRLAQNGERDAAYRSLAKSSAKPILDLFKDPDSQGDLFVDK